jgi:hypothetical protein
MGPIYQQLCLDDRCEIANGGARRRRDRMRGRTNSASDQNAKYSPGVEDFRVAPNTGHRQSSRTLLGI